MAWLDATSFPVWEYRVERGGSSSATFGGVVLSFEPEVSRSGFGDVVVFNVILVNTGDEVVHVSWGAADYGGTYSTSTAYVSGTTPPMES